MGWIANDLEVFRENARRIVKYGFVANKTLPLVMIDKCRAEAKALHEGTLGSETRVVSLTLETVWGKDLRCRLCQFHVIQAIGRGTTDLGDGEDGLPKMTRAAKAALCDPIRKFQRLRSLEDLEEATEIFLDELDEVVDIHYGRSSSKNLKATQLGSMKREIRAYFLKNWLNDFWLSQVYFRAPYYSYLTDSP